MTAHHMSKYRGCNVEARAIDTLKLMYNAIVLPHFDYADTVYDAASETNKSRLHRLQTQAARLISGTGPRDSRNPVFKELRWLSL